MIVVSDYAGGEDKSWNDIRATLSALARQTFAGSMEVILVEYAGYLDRVPADLKEILPDLNFVAADDQRSFRMKHVGIAESRAPFLGVLDADCVPDPRWVEAGVVVLRNHPEVSVCSGLTNYPNRTRRERIVALTGRSHVCRPAADYVGYVASNNSMYRRSSYLRVPFRDEAGPFAGRLHAHAMLRQGHRFYFEPAMRVVHDFEGMDMERDIRRNTGFATVHMRQLDRTLPFAWLLTLNVASIPLLFLARLCQTWGWCLRYGRYHGVAWYEVPLALVSAIRSHAYEVPGMWRAFGHRPIEESMYR